MGNLCPKRKKRQNKIYLIETSKNKIGEIEIQESNFISKYQKPNIPNLSKILSIQDSGGEIK